MDGWMDRYIDRGKERVACVKKEKDGTLRPRRNC
jgi:hypothetical protein